MLSVLSAHAQPLRPVPALTGHVIDQTATLDATQRQALQARLEALERDKGAQLVVLVVPSTAPEDIAAYAHRVGDSWKIGRAGVGDGLILLVALEDRRVRIEVAKTLEGAVPDLMAKRIIDGAIVPHFRAGDYAGGLIAAVTQLDALVRGEALPPVAEGAAGGANDFDWLDAAVLLLIAIPVVNAFARAMFGRKLGAVATGTGAGALTFVLTTSVWLALLAGVGALAYGLLAATAAVLPRTRSGGPWGGPDFPPSSGGRWGGGGGFGGGGFSSGGGGNFGGGGASGSW